MTTRMFSDARRARIAAMALAAFLATPFAGADAIDDLVRTQMELQHVPAVAVAVLKEGRPLKVRAYGSANLEHAVPATPDTVFQIGSVSKQFIAAGVLLLVQDGRLSLEDSLARHVAGSPESWQAITVRHLLTHTAGLPRETQGLQTRNQSDLDTLKEAMALPALFAPGANHAYSNVGYSALAAIITEASGMPWPQFMQQRVFAPLGMQSTRTTSDEALVAQRADGYVWNGSAFQNSPAIPGLRPSGAFLSTVNDLARWDEALRTDKLLRRELRERMWTPVALLDGSTKPYGFGWELSEIAGHRVTAHAGTMLGYRASLARYPDDGLTVIVLTNAFGALPERMGERIAALHIDGLHPDRRHSKVSPALLDRLAGEYRAGNNVITVLHQNGRLVATRSVGGRSLLLAALLPESAERFFDELSPRGSYSFEPVAQGMSLVMRDETGKEMWRAERAGPVTP